LNSSHEVWSLSSPQRYFDPLTLEKLAISVEPISECPNNHEEYY
jgi:hypothetical protein